MIKMIKQLKNILNLILLVVFLILPVYQMAAQVRPNFRVIKNNEAQVKTVRALENIVDDLPEYESSEGKVPWKDFQIYLDFYGMDLSNAVHRPSMFVFDSQRLFMHVIETKKKYRGTVLHLHGFSDHSANSGPLTQFLVDQGFNVILVDLPGHGLSWGPRQSVDDFHVYRRMIDLITDQVVKKYEKPYLISGHSTGGGIALDYLMRGKQDYQSMILFAPLIHWATYDLSVFGYKLIHSWLPSNVGDIVHHVPRFPRDISSDEDFKRYKETVDPVKEHAVPLDWVGALLEWHNEIENIPPLENKETDVLIFQGDHDVVVDWKYNLNFLSNRIGEYDLMMIDNGKHQLINEVDPIQEKIFSRMKNYLDTNVSKSPGFSAEK